MNEVTRILANWSNESSAKKGEVIATLYDELRRLAASQLHRSGSVVDVQSTSLVNEAYFKLVNISRMDLQGRSHFFGLAGRIMREVLVDEARRARSKKRDQALQTRLTGDWASDDLPAQDLLELDEILGRLEALDPVYLQLFEARIFAGMTVDEIAINLDLSPSTVKRKWKVVLAWCEEQRSSNATSDDD